MGKVATFTVLHDDMQEFFVLFEVVLVYFDKVGMLELLHYVDLPFRLFGLERVDLDLFVGKFFTLLVHHQIHAAKGTLTNQLLNLVFLHPF